MTAPHLPPHAAMRVLLHAMMANDPAERATLLRQACPSIDQEWALRRLRDARLAQDARRGYDASKALHGLLDAQTALDRQESN